MKPNEHGVTPRIDCRFDLTGLTNVSLDVTRPDGSAFTIPHERFSVGLEDVQDEQGATIMLGNQYVYFVTEAGEFTSEGDYALILTADFGSGKRLKTVETIFNVEA